MILAQAEIRYQGKVVFERLVLSTKFTRVPKFFQEDEACFLYLTKGAFNFRTPVDVLHFSEGDAMLAKCGNYFIENISLNKQLEQEFISVVGAFFYPEMVKDFFQSDLSIQEFKEQKDAVKINVEPLIMSYLDSLNFLLDHPGLADENLVVTKLKELLILLSKSEKATSISDFVQSLFVSSEYEFKEVVRKNLYSSLSMNELAYLCGMSLATFKRKFAQVFHQSPAKYLLHKKLEMAEHQLLNQLKPISDIAYDCGFESVPHFNKAFKRHFHHAPSAYRLSQIDKNLS
jgi:AraC family transcriptional regulator, exoenzyme S synthesis regulatory protein ExsA